MRLARGRQEPIQPFVVAIELPRLCEHEVLVVHAMETAGHRCRPGDSVKLQAGVRLPDLARFEWERERPAGVDMHLSALPTTAHLGRRYRDARLTDRPIPIVDVL